MRVLDSTFVISASAPSGAPPGDLPEVAFLGRSNVGKSSMINALLHRRKLARVSNTPGRTRLLNFFVVRLEDAAKKVHAISLCDLPGYGFAKGSREESSHWKAMIEGYLKHRETLKITVALIDSRHGPTQADQDLFAWMAEVGRPVITVATKIDKIPKAQRKPQLQAIGNALDSGVPIGFSSETDEGWDAVWDAIAIRLL